MLWEIGPGWNPLVETFINLIERDADYNKITPVVIQQIKEKMGELRIYYVGGGKQTDGYAEFARLMSLQMCEECGAPASLRSKNGWFQTRCEDHI